MRKFSHIAAEPVSQGRAMIDFRAIRRRAAPIDVAFQLSIELLPGDPVFGQNLSNQLLGRRPVFRGWHCLRSLRFWFFIIRSDAFGFVRAVLERSERTNICICICIWAFLCVRLRSIAFGRVFCLLVFSPSSCSFCGIVFALWLSRLPARKHIAVQYTPLHCGSNRRNSAIIDVERTCDVFV